jgi:parvulin-like peptidyl-prolyl isomerase
VCCAGFDAILTQMPEALRSKIADNPEEILRSYGVSQRLAEMAESLGSPYREQVMVAHKNALAAWMTNHYYVGHPVSAEEQQKYYDAHRDDYMVARLKTICVPIRSEDEAASAKAKAEELRKQLSEGADFAALAARYPGPAG